MDLFKASYYMMVLTRLQPQSLCYFVNQLDTARRFMYNEVTTAKSPVDPCSITLSLPLYCNLMEKSVFMILVSIEMSKGKHE